MNLPTKNKCKLHQCAVSSYTLSPLIKSFLFNLQNPPSPPPTMMRSCMNLTQDTWIILSDGCYTAISSDRVVQAHMLGHKKE